MTYSVGSARCREAIDGEFAARDIVAEPVEDGDEVVGLHIGNKNVRREFDLFVFNLIISC